MNISKLLSVFAIISLLMVSLGASAVLVGAQEETPDPVIYVVQEGDTYGSIAEAHGITVEALLEANGLDGSEELVPEQELVIPEPVEAETPTEEATEEPTAEPTEEATAEPTEEATEEPTAEPTEEAAATPESDIGTDISALATFPSPGQGSTNVYVQNLDTENAISVQADYYDQGGNLDASVGKTIEPLAAQAFLIDDSGLSDTSWIGSMVVSASGEATAVAELLWDNNPWHDGKTAGVYSSLVPPSTGQPFYEVYMPALYRWQNSQASVIAVQNADDTEAEVYMNYYDRDTGNLLGTVVDTLPAHGQQMYNTGGSPPEVPSLPNQWHGALYITSTNRIAATQMTHWTEGLSAANNGFVGGSDTIYLSNISRFKTGSDWYQYTGVVVMNLDTVDTTTIDVYWYDRDGDEALHFQDVIPPLSSHGYNTRWGGSVSANTFNALGTQWNGSVFIQSSGESIIAQANMLWGTLKTSGTYNSNSSGGTRLYFPYATRKSSGWSHYSSVIVQNIHPTQSVRIHTEWYDRNGVLLLTTPDYTIPANSSIGYNTRYGVDGKNPGLFNALGNNFEGSVYVVSETGQPIIGSMRMLWGNQRGALYDAYVVE
jgi:LysM repeat protein